MCNNKLKFVLVILGLLIPLTIIYKAFLISGYLAFGDAPYFYSENLKELFYQPLLWDFRNDNFGESQVKVLWLYLPTFLMGLFYQLFGGSHDIWVRAVFYFPSIILAALGTWLYIGLFTKNLWGRFLATYLYSLNTYILMVLDGGQIGIALAYGVFPNAVFYLTRYFSLGRYKDFLLAILFLFLLMNIDLRVFILAIIFYTLYELCKLLVFKQKIKTTSFFIKGTILFVVLISFNLFWLIPFLININNLGVNSLTMTLSKEATTLINGFLLFHPQFPINEFGRYITPPFYFGLVPLIMLAGLVIRKNEELLERKYYFIFVIIFLTLVFLVKGSNDPFGFIYSWIVNYIPLSFAFRDSTKFFIPLLLSSAVLLALVTGFFQGIFKDKKIYLLFVLVIYVYLSFLLYPALIGELTGTLGGSKDRQSYEEIYERLSKENGFLRTLWFPERPPLAFGNWDKPVLSANSLYKEYPFAAMITGDYDLFYYLHDPLLTDWFRLLGIKYVFFPEDTRRKILSDKQIEERALFEQFVKNMPGFKQLSWNIKFPGLVLENPIKDKIFTQNKILIVLGDSSIYGFLKEKINFDLTNTGALFLEDGVLNIDSLSGLSNNSAILVAHNRSKEDLKYTLLSDKFIKLGNYHSKQWGYYNANQYLDWKAEIIKNGVEISDIGFRQGLIFSSIPGEKISYRIRPSKAGKYYLAVRSISSQDGVYNVKVANQSKDISSSNKFFWNLSEGMDLNSEEYTIEIENKQGFNAINSLALFDQQAFNQTKTKVDQLIAKFGFFDLNDEFNIQAINQELNKEISNVVQYQIINPTKYTITLNNQEPAWIVFSDRFHEDWILKGSKNGQSYPLYSMINGFWVDSVDHNTFTIEYLPQQIIPKALMIWGLSIMVVLVVFVYLSRKKYEG